MNTALEIIEEVEGQDCDIETDGERLCLKAEHPLPSELIERLKANRAEVIACLIRRWVERHERSDAYIRAVFESHWNPEVFWELPLDYRRTWQAAVYHFMMEDGMSRYDAERKAWVLLLPLWGKNSAHIV